jgi:hemerythrin
MRYRGGMALDRDLRLDVPAIDAEHALQVELVEALGRAVAEGKSREVADEILERLLDYTRVHFLAEELMMRMEGYPGYEAHHAEHGELLGELQKLRAAHARNVQPVTHDAVAGLRSWLAGHVRAQDRAFANFLSARAAGRAAV